MDELMFYLVWLIFGVVLSVLSLMSISRTISVIFRRRSMRIFWSRYIFRFCLVGLGLLIAVQWGAGALLAVFLGFQLFRWSLIIPGIADLVS